MRVERELPAAPGMVSRWVHGDRRPRGASIDKLHALLGIPKKAWTQAPKKVLRPARPASERAA